MEKAGRWDPGRWARWQRRTERRNIVAGTGKDEFRTSLHGKVLANEINAGILYLKLNIVWLRGPPCSGPRCWDLRAAHAVKHTSVRATVQVEGVVPTSLNAGPKATGHLTCISLPGGGCPCLPRPLSNARCYTYIGFWAIWGMMLCFQCRIPMQRAVRPTHA